MNIRDIKTDSDWFELGFKYISTISNKYRKHLIRNDNVSVIIHDLGNGYCEFSKLICDNIALYFSDNGLRAKSVIGFDDAEKNKNINEDFIIINISELNDIVKDFSNIVEEFSLINLKGDYNGNR